MERRQYFLNEGGDNSNHLLGLSDDHVLVHGWMTMKSSPTPIMGNQWSDELGAVLISGNRSRSHFESNSPIHQNLSSPPPDVQNDTTFSSGGHSHNKRKAASSCNKVGGETKKMKIYEEEDSRISEQNSNSTTAAAVAAAGKTSETTKSDNNSKASEAPKTSYIHVRARRGQATDSHSLAERVRREKISERMKYLQDLVPGCNKITGKAGVLDEIINYVQSLQRQVEFLSMKLAALSPRMNLEMGNYIPKDIYPSSEMGTHFQLENHSDLRRTIAAPAPAPAPVTLTNPEALLSPSSHISWENPFIHQSSFFPGFMGTGNVKMEI